MKIRQLKQRIQRMRAIVLRKHRCPECGKRGPHWIATGVLFNGFWTCDKFYGPDGRRIAP